MASPLSFLFPFLIALLLSSTAASSSTEIHPSTASSSSPSSSTASFPTATSTAFTSSSTIHPPPTTSAFTSSTTIRSPPPPSPPPPPPTPFTFIPEMMNVNANVKPVPSVSPFSSVIPILTELGFHDLAVAAHSVASPSSAWPGPFTVFAPSDSALRTCPSCSPALLLQEHTVPGLYSIEYLSKLAFGTKIETILPGRCLTVTSALNASKIFVGGAEITRPDLVNNGRVVIHGLQGFVAHLSPYSCSIDKMTSLSIPHPTPSFSAMRLMLTDVMVRLRTSGYSVLALALRVKYPELVTLHNMTVFALDDAAIFHAGHPYVRDVRFHIVPNQYLMMADLEQLPASTVLPTLESGESLVVTTASGGGILAPMRLNYVRIKIPNLIHNLRIVVHGLAVPFPHLRQTDPADAMWSASAAAAAGLSGYHNSVPVETSEPVVSGSDLSVLGGGDAEPVVTAAAPEAALVSGEAVPGSFEAEFQHGF